MEEQKKRPIRKKKPNNGLAVNVLMLIVIALIVFEGKSLLHLFSKESYSQRIKNEVDEVLAQVKKDEAALTEPPKKKETKAPETQAITQTPDTPASDTGIAPEYRDVVVPQASAPVDDSFFKDAVFIGDSRMEGFRNQSGITEGAFLTAVGMTLENIYNEPYIATANGLETIFDALKKAPYKKVYMMIGTNELGTYDYNVLKELYAKVLADIHTIQPEAVIYVCSVIYVEETLTEFDYVNNANVDKINEIILQICKENNYHYLNLNEVLSDGNSSLIQGASSDGVHLEAEYLEKWLDYTKNHYITDNGSVSSAAETEPLSSSAETTTNTSPAAGESNPSV